MKNTHRLIAGMETFGFERAVTPDVNVATFIAKKEDIPKPWKVSWTRRPPAIAASPLWQR